MILKVLVSATFFFNTQLSFSINENDVISSAIKNFPSILQGQQKIEGAKSEILKATSAYDVNLVGKLDKRLSGYYDGESAKLQVEKRLKPLNSKFFFGYRVSNDELPIYEGKTDTLDDGEIRLGFELSLLKNSTIDKDRFKIRKSKTGFKNQENYLQLMKRKIQADASKVFWDWYAVGKEVFIREELLSIAKKRGDAIRRRVQGGDLARIYRIENQQYIVKRQSDLLYSQQEFQNKSIQLSLYMRDNLGVPKILKSADLPQKILLKKMISAQTHRTNLELATKKWPEVKEVENLESLTKNAITLAKNSLLPKTDLTVEYSNDYGAGSKTLETPELRVGLKFSFPLQQSEAKADLAKQRAKVSSLKFKKRLIIEKFKGKIEQLYNKLKILKQLISNTQEESEYAKILLSSEEKRFSAGASDFFLLNIRENKAVSAQIKAIKAKAEYQKVKTQYDSLVKDL